ncbi:hypothetical protein EGT50_16085 [Rhodococcus xishaensis]|uniref:Uncharacterized protein n=1 Tax=Rhodococcus xishaensis TaxID=2487364 RepID=A0A3S3ZGF6_9NOCA|nr:hypothetical protein EGT50_16085 [Rhodococcus xishaensis]
MCGGIDGKLRFFLVDDLVHELRTLELGTDAFILRQPANCQNSPGHNKGTEKCVPCFDLQVSPPSK